MFDIRPSDVTRELMNTVWQDGRHEIVAENILMLSRSGNGDSWEPFTWKDYVEFSSHFPSHGEYAILNEFANTGYLEKGDDGTYSFTQKLIEVYMRYTE